jgi:phospholipase C
MQGFVTDYARTLHTRTQQGWYVVPGTTAAMIMGCYTAATLPVLSALARGYAVCDRWFGSAPTETMPNRAFACAGTSQGHLDDVTKSFTMPSIFGLCGQHRVVWKIYGYNRKPLTRLNFPDTAEAPAANIGLFTGAFKTTLPQQHARIRFRRARLEPDGQQPTPQLQRRSR